MFRIELMTLVFMIPLAAIVFGIIANIFTTMSKDRRRIAEAQEETRREIAAYVAEGSLSPEQGERLLAAGRAPES